MKQSLSVAVVFMNGQMGIVSQLGIKTLPSAVIEFGRLLQGLRHAGHTVKTYTMCDEHDEKHVSFATTGVHCVRGTQECGLLPELKSLLDDAANVYMPRCTEVSDNAFSAVANTDLLFELGKYGPNIVIVIGATTQIGVFTTAVDIARINLLTSISGAVTGSLRPNEADAVRKYIDAFSRMTVMTVTSCNANYDAMQTDIPNPDEALWRLAFHEGKILSVLRPNTIAADPKETYLRLETAGVGVFKKPEDLLRHI